MGYLLACQVRMIEDISYLDSSVLTQLALAAPKDSNTVNLRLDTLAGYVKCSKRAIQYSIKRLEGRGFLAVERHKGGRGHLLKLTVVVQPFVDEVPIVPPEESPSPNGHKPAIPPPQGFTAAKSDEEELANLRELLAQRKQRQEQNVLAGIASDLLGHLIASTEKKIKDLEQKLEGVHTDG